MNSKLASRTLYFFVLLSALFFFRFPSSALAAAGATPEDRLFQYLEKKLPASGISLNCVSLYPETRTAKYIEFAVREKHEGKCPGDPSVAPIIDRYRVPKKAGPISIYDVVEDRWIPAP